MNDQLEAKDFTEMFAVCKKLDELDWIIGYEMTLQNYEVVDQALELARAVIAKVEKRSE